MLLVILAMATTVVVGAPTANAQATTCDGRTVTINMNTNGGNGTGTPGNDVILGTPGSDSISAGAGDDVVCAGGGRDWVYGQGGNDRLFGDTGRDNLNGGDGNDVLSGQRHHDVLRGGNGNDTIWGGAGNDTLEGGNGNDTLHGNSNNDTLRGGNGNDTANGGGGTDDCTAETKNSCETTVLPPAWVNGAELSIDKMAIGEFTVEWGSTSGNPHEIQFTLTDSNGVSTYRTENPQTASATTFVDLVPGEIYTLEAVLKNTGGYSDFIGLAEIPVLRYESVSELLESSSANLQAAGSLIQIVEHYSPTPCNVMRTSFGLKLDRRWATDHIVQFEGLSDFCSADSVMTENDTTVTCHLLRGNATLSPVAFSDPPNRLPNAPNVLNTFGCDISSQSTNSISLVVPILKTGAEFEVAVEEQIEIRVDMSITHELKALQSGVCITSTFQPATSGNSGSVCPPQSTHTG